MKSTLLELVQEILSSMDSDEVNSISDTVESYQVALLLRRAYYDLAIDLGLPEHEGLIELEASGDVTKPTLMTVPSGVMSISWIKYDNKEDGETFSNYKSVTPLSFPDFLHMMTSLREQEDGIGEMNVTSNGNSYPILYRDDKFPEYYTTIDDDQLIFDSYNSDIDSTLAKAKTMCYGMTLPSFTLSDNFIPDLNPQHFSLYVHKAKVRAFAEIKQMTNQEAASEARRQKIVAQFRGRKTQDRPGRTYKGYGRKD